MVCGQAAEPPTLRAHFAGQEGRQQGGGKLKSNKYQVYCLKSVSLTMLVSKMVITCVMNIPVDIAAKEAQASSLASSWLVEGSTDVKTQIFKECFLSFTWISGGDWLHTEKGSSLGSSS